MIWMRSQLILVPLQVCHGADLEIQVPVTDFNDPNGLYRLDYTPPIGYPEPNSTFIAADIASSISFRNGLPGTKYSFRLHYTNDTIHDWLTWTASITTIPDPPANLSINVRHGRPVAVKWDPPVIGGFSKFKLRLIPLNEGAGLRGFTLPDLKPGASYEIQLYTIFENKESTAYMSGNFTTKPNTPGRFIVWYRNETTLLVLWQPPYPAGIFTGYKVKIEPRDAGRDSELDVAREGEPPGPAQAAFNNLIPGRAYNISVETVSGDQISSPTTAQYRTVPLRPSNLTFDPAYITPYSFQVSWKEPIGYSEFDRYSVTNQGLKNVTPYIVLKNESTLALFDSELEPGRTYNIAVKTVSDKVPSWPVNANVTTRPLPVQNIVNQRDVENGEVLIEWQPHPRSRQDHYRITSQEAEAFGENVNSLIVEQPRFQMSSLFPGRNYSISIQAVANGIESEEVAIYQATRPSSPIVENLTALDKGLTISWKSDVTSRQDMYLVEYTRNDTGEQFNATTVEGQIIIGDLYSGATYSVHLYAVSHGLLSEKHEYFQTVFPTPPRNLSVADVSNSSIHLKWLQPHNSLFSGYVLRYRTNDNSTWVEEQLPSSRRRRRTVKPSGIVELDPEVDATNITLVFDTPKGRIEAYNVRWVALDRIPERGSDEDSSQDSQDESEGQGDENSGEGSKMELFKGEKTVEEEDWGESVRIPISPLMSGVAYLVSVETTSYGMKGNDYNVTIRTLPLITSQVFIVLKQNRLSEVTLTYTRTPITNSLFDRYRFHVSDPAIPYKEKLANDTERKVTFEGLVPGRLYNFTVWTVSNDVTSRPLLRHDRLYPESITMINASYISDTEMKLEWDTPPGDFDAFEVQFINQDDRLVDNLTLLPSITIRGLRPFRNYTFTVIVQCGNDANVLRRSSPVSAVFSTKESVPERVEYFEAIELLPNNITFEWVLPESKHNGIISSYVIKYGVKGQPLNSSKSFSPRDGKGTIIGLQPGVRYTFAIEARTKVGPGPHRILEKMMPIRAPPPTDPAAKPTEVSKTATTIKIRFRDNYFSNKNGVVKKYTIIVAEDKELMAESGQGLEPKSWSEVQQFNRWPAYQVVEPYNPFGSGKFADFEIGGNRSCNPNKKVYCNGPLRAGRTYFVKIRAFTDDDKFGDTVFSAMSTDQDNTWLILTLIIPLLLILSFVGCLLYVRRRRGGFGKRAKKGGTHDDTASLPESIIEPTRPVKLKEFGEHYRKMSADSDFRFSEEFEELKRVGREQLCTAADLPVNRPKNRFTNILPYDQSRYKLQPTDDDEGSDYINANYVTGFNSPREFIVTQGPLPSTRDDFWRMCWESNSRAIVMLTRCVEKGREKCDRYWPCDTMPQYYGDIQVQILNESRFPDWIISEFRMQRGDTYRIIKHLHFTTWPDFGVPDPPQILVRFVRAFRDRVPQEIDRVRPIVVHCSAGVGRSGTFIALDRILQHIKKSDIVDIFGIVYNMRRERVWMVQTEQQYICIHQCLLSVLEGKENDIPSPREINTNDGFEDDEGIAESGM
ncbi:Tyrosine-protein phosphatase 10D [Orchesella cincta]|uniref:protein-tyrosine-phosphatase n=1 Tax=Orchesella cincta TaxID=48709 RepID=A0A1D2MAW3_ORCCI|nr:Tyrosine-protein phosphatase 10D [Orchesella cincta]